MARHQLCIIIIIIAGNIREVFFWRIWRINKIRQNKNSPNYNFIQLIHYTVYRAIQGSKTAKLKLGQMSRLQIRQNLAPPN